MFALTVKGARELMASESIHLGRAEISRLFELVESAAQYWEIPDSVRSKALYAFRQRVLDFGVKGVFSDLVSRETMRLKAIPKKSYPRPIISDLLQAEGSIDERVPISALAHHSIKDLEHRALSRINLDLQKIIDACVRDLCSWEQIRQDLSKCTIASPAVSNRAREAFARSTSECATSAWVVREIAAVSAKARIELYMQHIRKKKLASLERSGKFRLFWIENAFQEIYPSFQKRFSQRCSSVMFLPDRLHTDEVFAIFMLLKVYTGWNMESLLQLTADKIIKNENGYEIQGFKSKTDDDTPSIFIDKTFRFGEKSLQLILWNLQQLKKLGRVCKNESHLWFTYSNSEYKIYTRQYVGFQKALYRFCDWHNLPRFTYEQVRTQVLMQTALSTRSLDSVRRVAGHRSLTTTGVYLDQEFARRLASANNLEFQRRLEATVKFRLTAKNHYSGPKADSRFVDITLMVPVGDGTLCTDPKKPPDLNFLDGQVCDGRRCHVDGQCANQRIVIDENRLEELVRKRRYYHTCWSRLHLENAQAFYAIHAPNMLFTLALYNYIKNGQYGHLLKYIERSIFNGDS